MIRRIPWNGFVIFSHPVAATFAMTGRARCRRILLNYVNQLRKKLIITLIYFISFLTSSQLDRPEIDAIALPSPPHQVARPLWSPLCRACMILVGCCVKSSSGGHLSQQSDLFSYFFVASLAAPTPWNLQPESSAAVTSRYNTSPHRRHCLLVGCCVSLRLLVAVYCHGVNFSIWFSVSRTAVEIDG